MDPSAEKAQVIGMPSHCQDLSSIAIAGAVRNVLFVITSIFITTIAPLPGWASIERITHEHGMAGHYRRTVAHQRRTTATIQMTIKGAGRCRNGDSTWTRILPGQALVFHAGEHEDLEYEADPLAGHWTFIYLNVDGAAVLTQISGLVARAGHVMSLTGSDSVLRRWLAVLPESGAIHRVMDAMESSQLVGDLLLRLARGAAAGRTNMAPGIRGTLAEQALHELSKHWRNPPNAARLARTLGVSREHLVRAVRHATGLPPATWVRHYRVQRAVDHLLSAPACIADIGAAAGFATPSHFVRAFSAVMGETPAAYRQRRMGGNLRKS